MVKKIITINIDVASLKIIDKAANRDKRSRSVFLELAGISKAKNVGTIQNE